jgi:hypothetical protein
MEDDMNVRGAIDEARALMGTDEKRAARILTDAAVECHDAAEAREIRALGEQGLAAAGRFSRGRWQEVIRLADKHGAAV